MFDFILFFVMFILSPMVYFGWQTWINYKLHDNASHNFFREPLRLNFAVFVGFVLVGLYAIKYYLETH